MCYRLDERKDLSNPSVLPNHDQAPNLPSTKPPPAGFLIVAYYQNLSRASTSTLLMNKSETFSSQRYGQIYTKHHNYTPQEYRRTVPQRFFSGQKSQIFRYYVLPINRL